MKRLIIVILIVISSVLVAQQTSLILNLRIPVSPRITDWQRDPSYLQLKINNPPNTFYIYITISNISGKEIASTNKNSLPLFTATAKSMTLFGNQIFNYNSLTIDQSIRDIVIRTNLLPEGNYIICIQLLDKNKSELGERACRSFYIFISDPPNLVFPSNGDIINNNPQFNWTPVAPGPDGINIEYKIYIVPIFKGQIAREAIERNPSLISEIVNTTTYQYLPSDQPFSFYPEAIGFAWQVQALNDGIPVIRNEGKSEIFTFYLSKPNDSIDIYDLKLKFSTSIDGLKVKFKSNDEIQRILIELDNNSLSIFNNIKNPSPAYLKSLKVNAMLLSEVLKSDSADESSKIKGADNELSMNEGVNDELSMIEGVNDDMAAKEKSWENSNGSDIAFQEIKVRLQILQADAKTLVTDAYRVRAIPWALRNEGNPEKFNDAPVISEYVLWLVAGVYDMWVVPVSDEEKRYPPKNEEKEISYPMREPIKILIK